MATGTQTNLCIKQTYRNGQDSYFTTGEIGATGPNWYLTNINQTSGLTNLTISNATSVYLDLFTYNISSLSLQNRGTITFDISLQPNVSGTTITNTSYNQFFCSFQIPSTTQGGKYIGGSGCQDIAVLLNSSDVLATTETNFKITVPIATLSGVGPFGTLRFYMNTDGTNRTGTFSFTYRVVCYLS